MNNELCIDNIELSDFSGMDTPQSYQQTPVSNMRYPVKINLQNNPITLAVKRANNDYGLVQEPVNSEGKFKVIKYNNRDIKSSSVRDFSENFIAKRIPVEKNFVRINYLKNKQQEVRSVEDIVGCSTISTINQSNNERSLIGGTTSAQTQKKERSKKANLSKSISKTTIGADSQQKNTQHFKKRTSISNSTKYAPPSARSNSKKVQNTPTKNNSFSERKSQKKCFNRIISRKSPPHKLNSSSSCCSCCKSSGSPMSSAGHHNNIGLPSEGVQSSVYHSISQRAQSVNSKKSNQSGLRSSFNIHFDLSQEWNHKSSILSSSGQNKTSEYLQKKIQQIFERKQEKQQIKSLQNAEKIVRNELYGMFSRQSRDMKQKRLQEKSILEEMQKQLIQTVDPEKVEKVDKIIRESIEKYSLQKRLKEEETENKENQKKDMVKKLKDYDEQVKLNNYIMTERKSKSRENSQKRDIPSKPWGIDQRKFEDKSKQQQASDQQKVKIVKKEKIDLKNLFSQNDTVNQLLKQIKQEQKKQNEEVAAQQNKQTKHSQSSNDIRQDKKIDANEFNKKMEDRLKKIVEEKRNKAKELKTKKQDINQKLDRIEKDRKESLSKCRKIAFKPTQEQIEKAFNILQQQQTEEIQQNSMSLIAGPLQQNENSQLNNNRIKSGSQLSSNRIEQSNNNVKKLKTKKNSKQLEN